MQEIIAVVIVIAAACGLYILLKRNKKDKDCSHCPLSKECGKKSTKNRATSCTNKK